jgi:hypothetical protein
MINEKPRRDVIQNRERAQQINSFEGMNFPRRGIPTDIDGFIEYDGKLFINFEGKHTGVEMKYGQRLSFEHLTQSHKRAGDTAFVLVYEHDVPVDEDVIVKDQLVTKVYSTKDLTWNVPTKPITVQQAIDGIIKYCIRESIIEKPQTIQEKVKQRLKELKN